MKNLIQSALITSLCLSIVACGEVAQNDVKTPLVDTYVIPVKNNEDIQNLSAVVKASDYTKLSFRVNGELIKILVKSGEEVKKGQLLAKLDPTNFQLSVNDKRSKTELAKKSRERAAKMVELGNMAQSVLDELDARYRVLKAEYAYAQLQLSYVELRAPFAGVISSVPADNFQNTAVGQTVMTMHSKDKVEIQVSLPDLILSAAQDHTDKSNYEFNVLLDAYPGHVFKAKYKEHTAEQTTENKKYMLILEMPVDKERITLQGMPGNIQLDLAKLKMKNFPVYKVPVEAVTLPDYKSDKELDRVVWRLLPDNTVEPVSVIAESLASLSLLNVSGDLKAGDKIITKGMTYLTQGMKVNTKTQGALTE